MRGRRLFDLCESLEAIVIFFPSVATINPNFFYRESQIIRDYIHTQHIHTHDTQLSRAFRSVYHFIRERAFVRSKTQLIRSKRPDFKREFKAPRIPREEMIRCRVDEEQFWKARFRGRLPPRRCRGHILRRTAEPRNCISLKLKYRRVKIKAQSLQNRRSSFVFFARSQFSMSDLSPNELRSSVTLSQIRQRELLQSRDFFYAQYFYTFN